jgi:hypothetical protein
LENFLADWWKRRRGDQKGEKSKEGFGYALSRGSI